MPKLNLSIAVRDYDRTRPLSDGTVQIDGVDPVFLPLEPEEIFFRAFRHAEFDICELSMSSSVVKTAQGDFPYVAVPAFVSRAFRHTSIYVRTDRLKQPADLKGRRVGLSEYQLTANVWARALLEDQYGVRPSEIHWIRGGLEEAGRVEKVPTEKPAAPGLDTARSKRSGPGRSLSVRTSARSSLRRGPTCGSAASWARRSCGSSSSTTPAERRCDPSGGGNTVLPR